MGRITSFSKQVIVFVIALTLITRPVFASTFDGWSIGNPVAVGASTVYEGTKQIIIDGKNYIKTGTAKITPAASQVSKVLARGVAGVALSVAVEQLLGAVDWVLDPANNRVVYLEPAFYDVICFGSPNAGKCSYNKTLSDIQKENGCTLNKVPVEQQYSGIYWGSTKFTWIGTCSSGSYGQGIMVGEMSASQKLSIPLDVVSAQVISNAESDTDKKAGAQVATMAAAADVVAEAEGDSTKAKPIVDQLNGSSSTKPADSTAAAQANTATGSQTQNPSKPDTTDLKLEFPAFCGWAPIVCEAAQTVISFPITLTEWWETGKTKAEEWSTSISDAWSKVKEEYNEKPKEDTDTELDIPDQSPPDINTDISFGGSCPASRSVPVSFAGISTEIEFSFQWFCEIASIAKPVIISISAFASALIVAGVRTEDD